MEVLGVVNGAGNLAVNVDLENAVVLTDASNGVLGSVVHNHLGNGANAIDLEIGLARVINTELVSAFLLDQRALTRGLDLGEHTEASLRRQRILCGGKLLGVAGQAGRATGNNHIILVEHNGSSIIRNPVTGGIGQAGNLDVQLAISRGIRLALDMERDVIGRSLDLGGVDLLTVDGEYSVALDLLIHTNSQATLAVRNNGLDGRALLIASTCLGRVDLLTVDGEYSVALDLLIHTNSQATLAVRNNGLDGRALLIASTCLGNADSKRFLGLKLKRNLLTDGEGALVGNLGLGSKRFLGLKLKRNLLTDGEGALVGNLGLGTLLGVTTLDDVVELLALAALHAKRGIVEREVKLLSLAVICIADGQDALVTLETSVAVGVVHALAVVVELRVPTSVLGRSAGIQRNALNGPLTKHPGIAQKVEVLLVPLEELRIHLVLLSIEDRVGVIQLPERRATASHGVKVVLELLSRRSRRVHRGAGLAVHRVMVIDVVERELELMLFNKAVVHSVSRVEVAVVNGAAVRGTSMVELALEPHGVNPLQQPRARNRVRGARNPVVGDVVLLSVGANDLVQVNPGLPHVGAVVHLVSAADHVTLGLAVKHHIRVLGLAILGTILVVVVVLSLIGKAIPLPVVNVILVLEFANKLSIFLQIRAVRNVNRAARIDTQVLLVELGGNGAVRAVATTRTNPHTEVRSEVLDEFRGRSEPVREFVVELPEARICSVVGPTVINNVRIERAKLRVAQLTIDLSKRAQNGLVADVLLVVVPGVVLNAELGGRRDVVDVIEEVRLDHAVVSSICGTGNRRPRGIADAAIIGARGLLVISEALHRLARVITRATDLLVPIFSDDLRIRRRELAAKEHTIGVEGLAENGSLLGHANDRALVGRDGPLTLGVRHVERLEVDVVDLGVKLILFGNGDLQILAHVVIAVVSHDVLGDGIGRAVELNRLELEGQLLTGLLLLIDGGRSIRNHRVAIKLKLARLEEHVGLNGLNPLLGVEIKFLGMPTIEPWSVGMVH